MANRVAESRRGFLARFGKAALAAAAAVVGLLALPKEAQAGNTKGFCEVTEGPGGSWHYTGRCVSPNCATGVNNKCLGAAPRASRYLCGAPISVKGCSF
jgi:hypothetical protein